jgi:hypothetical protein
MIWGGKVKTLTWRAGSSFTVSLFMWREQLSIKRTAGSFSSPGVHRVLAVYGKRTLNKWSLSNNAFTSSLAHFLSVISIPTRRPLISSFWTIVSLVGEEKERGHLVATSWDTCYHWDVLQSRVNSMITFFDSLMADGMIILPSTGSSYPPIPI